MVDKIQAAGGIVVNDQGQVVIVNQNGDSWSMPKGHVDPGENHLETAKREIYEESGINDLMFVKELGSYSRQRIGKGGVGRDTGPLKEITFYLFRSKQANLKPVDPDNPEARWVTPAEAYELLTHPRDKAFFQKQLPHIRGLHD